MTYLFTLVVIVVVLLMYFSVAFLGGGRALANDPVEGFRRG